MKIGIYCGSFSPVHKGHIIIAKECVKQRLVDKVLIIATGNYWQKNNLLPLEDRIRMLKFYEDDTLIIDEKYNDYPYTYLIFKQLTKDYPEDEFTLILGSDNLEKFSDWKHYKTLLKYPMIIVEREGFNKKKIIGCMKEFNKNNYVILDTDLINISSTEIRDNIDDYDAIKDMLDIEVYEYLKKIKGDNSCNTKS